MATRGAELLHAGARFGSRPGLLSRLLAPGFRRLLQRIDAGLALGQINGNPGVLLSPRIRRSPYFYASGRHGVQLYSFYNPMYHPRHYGDPVEEYWQLLNGVTLWDVGVERQVEITGPDAFTFTNMLVPRDLNKCAVGQCKYVFVTSPEGGILNDPVLLRVEENRWWLALADSDAGLYAMGVAVNSGLDVHVAGLAARG